MYHNRESSTPPIKAEAKCTGIAHTNLGNADKRLISIPSAEGRLGFQQLIAEVSLDHVGLVLGIEMSRLARSNKDWHQLLELCALFRCLLARPQACSACSKRFSPNPIQA